MTIIDVKLTDLKPYEKNPRHNEEAVKYVAKSIKQFGFKVPIIIDKNNVIVAGHTRYKAGLELGLETVPCIIADDLTPKQIKAFRLADNKVAEKSYWDFDLLNEELADLKIDFNMSDFGFNFDENLPFDDSGNDGGDIKGGKSKDDLYPDGESGMLSKKFIVPPFTILDSRQGDWTLRKRKWRELIGDFGESREDVLSIFKTESSFYNTSLLDPVLSEIILKWFTPHENSKCFDVFAGDTVFGFVSAYEGHNFTGIELRQEQCDLNNERCKELNAKYICDDGRNVLNHIEEESQDLLFSCPPYYDLEVYSDNENDASNQETYEEFYSILDTAFSNAIKCLKNDRFATIVVGDIRNNKDGSYYDFCGDIKNTFKRNGMSFYNEIILINQYGTACLRGTNYMKSRKCVKVHQNVLVFYKGNTKNISKEFPEIEVVEDESENE